MAAANPEAAWFSCTEGVLHADEGPSAPVNCHKWGRVSSVPSDDVPDTPSPDTDQAGR